MGLQGVTINTISLQDGMLYAGSSKGIYRRENDTEEAEWQHIGPEKQVYDFVVWDDQTLLAGTLVTYTDTISIYKTTDGGSSWITYQQNFGRDERNNILFVVEQHPRDEELLFARGDFNVAKSENAGESWNNIYGSWDGYGAGYFITIYPSDPDIIWDGRAALP